MSLRVDTSSTFPHSSSPPGRRPRLLLTMDPQEGLSRGRPISTTSEIRPQPHLQPSLLPPFEPLSSSPTGLPKPRSRKHDLSPSSRATERRPYPTPVPTSSTAIPTSSPPHLRATRPGLSRTASTISERTPLGELPTAQLQQDGTALLFGRSSNSSHFQLSSNRLISRIHVEAVYEVPSEEFEQGRVLIKCLGWNGARVKSRGISHFLEKGQQIAFDNPSFELMLDVQDARVIVKWPQTRVDRTLSDFSLSTAHNSPTHTSRADIPSSPPMGPFHSPISPSPRRLFPTAAAPDARTGPDASASQVLIYEDAASDEEQAVEKMEAERSAADTFRDLDGEEDMRNPTQSAASLAHEQASHASSALSSPEEFLDHDEENDPYITSFGPMGANLLPRMASMHAGVSPERRRAPLKAAAAPSQPSSFQAESNVVASKSSVELSPIRNHVINQLAFSRVHALPLGTIYTNLPVSWREPKSDAPDSSDPTESSAKPLFTKEDLRKLLDDTAAVGEIAREGKDAAGKALEDEFYYVPEMDTDTMRRGAVQTSLGKTGMRAVRKQHKVSPSFLAEDLTTLIIGP